LRAQVSGGYVEAQTHQGEKGGALSRRFQGSISQHRELPQRVGIQLHDVIL
jgi:hypothetical protein